MALTFKTVGKGLKKLAKVAAPVAGFINPALGIGLGLASGLGEGKKSLKSMALGGLSGAAGGVLGKLGNVEKLGVLGGAKNLGGKALGGLGKLGKTVGKATTFTNGEFDINKLLGLGMAGSGFVGAQKDKAAVGKYNAGNAAMRNELLAKLAEKPDYTALMDRITARPNYTF